MLLHLEQNHVAAIGEAEWKAMLRDCAPISESYLRRLLQESGLPFDQPWAGIRQHTCEELEESLVRMERAYHAAIEAGDREQARYCRRQVIQAKDQARLASRNPKATADRRKQKEEMVQWMLVWLENPGVFESWVRLRRPQINTDEHR